jgi:hypothetical protein
VILALKVCLAAGAVAGWLALGTIRSRTGPGGPALGRLLALTWAATRLAVFVAVFVMAGVDAPSDASVDYIWEARAALDGGLVHRDFSSSYGPLFAYLAAGPVALWNDARVFVVCALAIELVALAAWARVGEQSAGRGPTRDALFLYLCNPLALLNVAVAGQNQIWIAALWGVAALLVVRGRPALGGAAVLSSAAMVKALGLLALPTLWCRADSRSRFAAGFAATAVAIYGTFALAGSDLLQPFRIEGDELTSGNLPYLLTAAGLDPLRPAVAAALAIAALVALAAAVWIAEVRAPGRRAALTLPAALSAVLLVFMIVSRKSFTSYLAMFLLPLSLALAPMMTRRWQGAAFLAFCGLAAIEPSLWFRWMDIATLDRGVPVGVVPARAATFMMVEVLLVVGYGVLAAMLLRARVQAGARADPPLQ